MPNAATNTKKFLDANGLTYFASKLNNYPDNTVLEAVIEGVQDALDEKMDASARGAANGVASLDAEGKVLSSQLPASTNTTYTLTQNENNGHVITLTGNDGSTNTITIPDNDTTYNDATTTESGLMSAADKIKLNNIAENATANTGTITEIVMNGASKGTSGSVDLGTVITDVSGKADKADTVSTVTYANKKLTKTINGTTTDVVTVATLKTDMALSKSDVGLGNVDNTSDEEKPISTATQAALDDKLDSSLKGAANGLAELDSTGKVPSSQLPSYVDDVEEYSTRDNFPLTGDTGKIYVNIADNKTYRWSGSDYVEISESLALGTTSSTAYRGDYGAAAYAHGVTNKGSAFASGMYKITTNSEGHVTNATAVVKSDITGLGIPAQDTTYTLSQDATDGHKITFTPSSGTGTTIVIPDNNTTYSSGTGLSMSGTTINHSNSITAGTAGSSSATSGSTLDVPYVTYDAQGHVTGKGTHTHTVTGFVATSQGTSNAGKFLVVNSSGNVEPVAMTAWEGGAY